MVKDRMRVMNTDSYARICAHTSTARKCGALVRTRIANATLASRKKRKRKTLQKAFQTIFYLTNTNVLRFNVTFIFLPNTNV